MLFTCTDFYTVYQICKIFLFIAVSLRQPQTVLLLSYPTILLSLPVPFWPSFPSPSVSPPLERNVVFVISLPANWHLFSGSVSVRTLHVNYKNYYCQWSEGMPLFMWLFLGIKLKYCTALAIELNSPDSCILCLVTLCVETFVLSNSVQAP